MTFTVLRALHAIIGDALDDIQRVYAPEHAAETHGPSPTKPACPPYASPPPSPSAPTYPAAPLDFPSLDAVYDPTDPAEQLTSHPDVVQAINRIVAAAGQLAVTVQTPFLALCDATMGYHLPSCMRLLEASHTVEILRDAGPNGLHVDAISQRNGVESAKLAHILRLLATHHILRERAPNVFTLNRISSLVDSGKTIEQLRKWEQEGRPEMKYHDTNGIAAFVGLNTDELQKSSGYLTEAYLLSRATPPRAPFEFAFDTDVGFFGWLEGEGALSKSPNSWKGGKTSQGGLHKDVDGVERGPGGVGPAALGHGILDPGAPVENALRADPGGLDGQALNPNKYRLERFGTAMSGTGSWEAPGAVLNGFDWRSLPRGSVIVDVGGGIGSTSMFLANTFSRVGGIPSPLPSPGGVDYIRGEDYDCGFKFVIQDRQVVVEMGEKAWKARCPELLNSGTARFQVHDFFTTQPIKNAAVFLLRVILHDWPDAHARMILLKLREAATSETKLVLADFVLPLACVDDVGNTEAGDRVLKGIEGAESMLAPAPLLANLGKASANAYWMDLTMQVTFNAQERTLRETAALALSAGWKVVKVTRAVGSLFGHIVAVPVPIPIQKRARAGSGSAFFDVQSVDSQSARLSRSDDDGTRLGKGDIDVMERASSRCGTPTFGSRTDLPSVQETLARFGGGVVRSRIPSQNIRGSVVPGRPGILKHPSVSTTPLVKKKKPSPLSLPPPLPSSPSPSSYRPLASPRQSQPSSPITRRLSQAHLYRPLSQQSSTSASPVPARQPPPSPMSPRHPLPHNTLTRRASHAQLSQHAASQSMTASIPPSPSLPRQYRSGSPHPALSRRSSHAHMHQPSPPSAIPIRNAHEPPPHLAFLSRAPPPPPVSTVAARHPPIPRRASYAQLPQAGSLRKRSGSVIGPSINGGIGGGISMASLLMGVGAGGALDFEGAGKEGETKPQHIGAGGRSVLAAAARIEKGIPSAAPSP